MRGTGPGISKWDNFIWLSVIAICAIFYFSLFTKKIFDDSECVRHKEQPGQETNPIILGTAIIMVIGLFSVQLLRLHHTLC